MHTTLTSDVLDSVLEQLARANATHHQFYPGESAGRQPVHTVYGGAQLFKPETASRLGSVARDLMRSYLPDAAALARCFGLPEDAVAQKVFDRIATKLESEPVEDFRIDFEDGYGNRPDAEEDGHAVSTAQALARGIGAAGFPPFIGIRIKPFSELLHARAIRTLDLFLTALIEAAALPENFVVTLPKITAPEQVKALVRLLDAIESRHSLKTGAVKIELMIEAPEMILDRTGVCGIPKLIDAGEGRCRGLHFGVFDYTATLNIASSQQSLVHPAADFARHVMQISAAGRGVMLSDSVTNILPIPRHRAAPGTTLSAEHLAENQSVVHRALRVHFEHVRRSLAHGFYQGWDLHPGQLPARYAAIYSFFLESFDSAAARLRNFVEKAAQATLVGEVFDDAATGQGLLNFFLRGINCGAFTEQEASAAGLTVEELRSKSFLKIVGKRSGQAA